MIIIEKILDLISPADCYGCGAEYDVLCQVCVEGLEDLRIDSCYACNKLTSDHGVCADCRPKTMLDVVVACMPYEGAIKRSLYAMKFSSDRRVTRHLAKLLIRALPYYPNKPDLVIVPVPTASSRVRQRGFDHMKMTAKHMAVQTGIKSTSCLVRLDQLQQVGSKRTQRLEQIDRSLRVDKPDYIQNKIVILVDDVVTTGATLDSCARALKRSGARKVIALVAARS